MDDEDGEINKFVKVWLLAITSLTYCYFISSRVSKGLSRLVSLLPIIFLFTLLPLKLTSFHLTGLTSFFLAWLANFKLLLFAFGQGPLSSPTDNLVHFILVASLPIKVKPHHQPPPPKSPPSQLDILPWPPNTIPTLFVVKIIIFVLLFQVYDYKQNLSHYMVLAIYCCHMYLELEMILALCAAPAHFLGFELEPQFNEPYLSTSLQDFWGKRWNLMVSSILRPTVYYPVRGISTRIVGKDGAQLLGVIAVFVVSGFMHELIYYYFARVSPTWEVTWFFVLHGVCVAIEIVVKRMVGGRWRLHRVVSGPLSIGFMVATGFWLFFPQLMRHRLDEKALGELAIFVDSIKGIVKHK